MGSRLEKNSNAVRKRIESHTFSDETGEEYEPSAFGGFPDYFRRKKIKLQNLDSELRAASADKTQIFRGVVAHVTGYTQPPLHILHRDLVQHGAGFLQYLDSKTMATHIIASTLPPKKMVEFNKYRIVKPAWVTDSIQAGKMLPWSDYRVVDETPRQKTLKLNDNGISTQAHSQKSPLAGYRGQTENSFYTSQLESFADTLNSKDTIRDSPSRLGPIASDSSDSRNDPDDVAAAEISKPGTNTAPDVPSNVNLDSATTVESNITGIPDVVSPSKACPQRAEVSEAQPSLEKSRAMTSEEHNALLLQDPRMRKSSTANPDFIQQYYSESRLHHLSTWKADLKSRMQKLAAEKGSQRKSTNRKPGARRYVMHVDFDSFFCAVSLKSAPEYVEKPTVVAHGAGTGSEIASCNYPARKFGVKNGMWMKRAKEMCPDLKVLPYDFPAYEEASKLFYESILDVGGIVQSVSIDEALVDATSVILSAVGSGGSGVDEGSIWREQEKADQIASDLRREIKEKTGCAVSVGIGGNILLAKVALRKAKPAGQYQIKPEEVQDFLGCLKVDDLPGVAYSIAGKLEEIGIKYVNDIRQTSKERLINTLGPKTGDKIWEYARGIDRTEIGGQPIRKSVSAEVNWGIRFINQEEAEEFVFNLSKELEKRLLNEQVKGKQLTMKIMRRSLDAPLDPPKHLGHGKCDTFNKSIIFGVATNDSQVLGKEAVSILRSYRFSPGDIRGLGAQLTKLEPMKSTISAPDGSQKRLSFGTFRTHGSAKKPVQDPIQDLGGTGDFTKSPRVRSESSDPIFDSPLTPRKPKAQHPALTIARAGEKDAKARTPLNVSGTQFIIPSNVDPTVLAELPADIRSRLMAQARNGPSPTPEPGYQASAVKSRTQSPAPSDEIPPEFDSEVFNALPEDMKAEILASHKRRARQTVLPQSPRKDRIIQPSKKTTPTKKRGPNLFSRARERQADAGAKIVQTKFLSRRDAQSHAPPEDEAASMHELDESFLAELPTDVRHEVIADHRRRKAQRSGLELKLNANKQQQRNQYIDRSDDDDDDDDDILPGGQMKINFPPLPPKIAFTTSGLTTVPEIRDMLKVWHGETRSQGPHLGDVEMLENYLVKVVTEEKNMDKVSKLLRWLEYLIDADEIDSEGKESWKGALQDIKTEVQKAVQGRGLAPLDMG
ncbi:impB/mucB/samB family protein [Xylariaceae sp. FL0016]|nr:impB/mucB/samB family protein [Xylariaceae sp. FL0016]